MISYCGEFIQFFIDNCVAARAHRMNKQAQNTQILYRFFLFSLFSSASDFPH